MKALDSRLAGNSVRAITKELFGAKAVEDWDPDGGPRSKTRYLLRRATGFMKGGYRRFLLPTAKPRRGT